jgi:hypothetical protein
MSFKQLKKDILFQVAEDFAVELPEGDRDDITKDQIIDALSEDGVTWDMYKKAFPSVDDQEDKPVNETVEPEVDFKSPQKQVLLKMTRANGTFVIRGHKFTKAHPFLPVSEDDANYITENVEGFKIANPREAEEFYS